MTLRKVALAPPRSNMKRGREGRTHKPEEKASLALSAEQRGTEKTERKHKRLSEMSLGPACIFLRGAKTIDRPLADEEIDELREAFDEFDKDKDGLISCKDLGNLMRTMGYMPTEMELLELSQNINMNLGGKVDFQDFVDLMTPKLLAETSGMIGLNELKEAFKEFDIDGDGAITIEELKHAMLKLLGETGNRKEIEAVVREADNNGDGTVDFEEFVKMMSKN